MASEIKLLPCPCCGAEAKVMIPQGHYFTFYQVVCTECELASKATPTVDMTVELWNTRKPLDRIVERLEEWTCEVDIKLPFDALENQKVIWSDEAIKIVKAGGTND
jgi:hypothetical protein